MELKLEKTKDRLYAGDIVVVKDYYQSPIYLLYLEDTDNFYLINLETSDIESHEINKEFNSLLNVKSVLTNSSNTINEIIPSSALKLLRRR